jgi:hypothetical protein
MFAQTTTVPVFARKNCFGCHNSKLKTANLDLTSPQDAAVWEDALDKVRAGEMPPAPIPRPKAADTDEFAKWVASQPRPKEIDPGRVTARRLNKYEYNATVRDLLAVDYRPADDFPADDSGYGFDNIADVLSLSPVLLEKYFRAAEKISTIALGLTQPVKPTQERHKAELIANAQPGWLQARHRFPAEAEYEIRVGLGGIRPYPAEPVTLSLEVEGETAGTYRVDPNRQQPRNFRTRLRISAGERTLRARFLNDSYRPQPGDLGPRDRRLAIDYIEVVGPYYGETEIRPASYSRVFSCEHVRGAHDLPCARAALSRLTRLAWRRPVQDREVTALMRFVEAAHAGGDGIEEGVRLAIQAILVSPNFLFRIERDAPAQSAPRRLTDLEFATRLSYFLWSSTPDDELLWLAEAGKLRQPEVLKAQLERLQRNPRSVALVENFGGQWLHLRNLESVKPDPDRFPNFDEDLREAMARETRMFFETIIREDRSILDFIDGRFTFLNERLAKHYGIPDVSGPEFRLVRLDGVERSGVLTHASILTVSSYPTRTSPVMRGKWILENILAAPPPPPPGDAGNLDETQVGVGGTVRQQFEQHRSNPACASCHLKMDPLGFGLENYDAVGVWRTREGEFPLDTSGTLPGGKSFKTPAELKSILLETEKDAFARCLAEKLLTYATGRGLERADRRVVRSIAAAVAGDGYKFSALIREIINSVPFTMRRPEVRTQALPTEARRGNR